MMTQVETFLDEGAITTEETARHLQTHLTTVEHYEDSGSINKAIKHMEGFIMLLEHHKEEEMISEDVFDALKTGADDLIDHWQ